MTSLSTSAQWSTSECTLLKGDITAKLPLLKILQAAGAQGEIKEVIHYLGQYLMVKQLYDQQKQHMVYCGGDPLGEILGWKDPSPFSNMLRKNLVSLATATTDAAQTLTLTQDHSMDIPSQDQLKQSAEGSSSSSKRAKESNTPIRPTSQHKHRNTKDEDLAGAVDPLPVAPALWVLVLVGVLVLSWLLLFQSSSLRWPGKAVEGGPSAWALYPYGRLGGSSWLLASDWRSTGRSSHLGGEPTEGRPFSLSLSLLTLPVEK
uniref:DM2 domain-containing protein n=1 Tax=Oryctolagus cuniculus TaxID=9986 RepID=A0A5F9C7Z0_RABIT